MCSNKEQSQISKMLLGEAWLLECVSRKHKEEILAIANLGTAASGDKVRDVGESLTTCTYRQTLIGSIWALRDLTTLEVGLEALFPIVSVL